MSYCSLRPEMKIEETGRPKKKRIEETGAVEGDRRYYTVGIERAGDEVRLRFVWIDLESLAIEGCMQKGAWIVLLLLFLILFFGVSSVFSSDSA
ncbi:hypothetical protein ABKV19_000621 [Rosa sericea]